MLCGGGAALPGLLSLLKQIWGAKVELFPVPEPLSPFKHVSAYGAALGGRPGYPRLELKPEKPESRANGVGLAFVVGLVLLIGLSVLDIELRHHQLVRRETEFQAILSRALNGVAGTGLPSDPIPERVEKLKKKIDFSKRVRLYSPHTFMKVMASLAAPLRKYPGLKILSIQLDEGLVTLEGHTLSPRQLEKFRKELDGKVLVDVKALDVKPGPDNTFLFKLEGRVNPI